MFLIDFNVEMYGFGWFRCGDVLCWLVSLRRCMVLVGFAAECMVLIGFVKGTYVFDWFRCGDV